MQQQIPQEPVPEQQALQDNTDGQCVDKNVSQNIVSPEVIAPPLLRGIEEGQNPNATNQYSFFSGSHVAFAVSAIAAIAAVVFMPTK